EIVQGQVDAAERRAAVRHYATTQGQELADLGVNLNFAPVVDLNYGFMDPSDRHTRIYQRAISPDSSVVTEVAGHYCSALQETGVRCTLKHFPGLGRVREDTHHQSADLSAPLSELVAADWVPFRALMSHVNALTMLGHARLVALDPERPASFSAPV